MGHTAHHAIIVTSWNNNHLHLAFAKAKELGLSVSNLVTSPMNGYWSFLVAPDGSKEGWHDSDIGNSRRDMFINFLRGPLYIEWLEVRYAGDSDVGATVTRHRYDEVSDLSACRSVREVSAAMRGVVSPVDLDICDKCHKPSAELRLVEDAGFDFLCPECRLEPRAETTQDEHLAGLLRGALDSIRDYAGDCQIVIDGLREEIQKFKNRTKTTTLRK